MRFSQSAHSLEIQANIRLALIFVSVILNLFQNLNVMRYAKPISPIKPINPETLTSVRVAVYFRWSPRHLPTCHPEFISGSQSQKGPAMVSNLQLFKMNQVGFYDGFGEGDDMLGVGGFGEFDGPVFFIKDPDAFILIFVSFTETLI